LLLGREWGVSSPGGLETDRQRRHSLFRRSAGHWSRSTRKSTVASRPSSVSGSLCGRWTDSGPFGRFSMIATTRQSRRTKNTKNC